MSDILYVDNSTLSATSCSTEALMRYGHGYTSADERAYLKAGTSGHAAVACWFRGGTKDEALDVFANGSWCNCSDDGVTPEHFNPECPKCAGTGRHNDGYQAWADDNVLPDNRLSFLNTSRIVDYWLDKHPLAVFPFKIDPSLVEIGFAFPLTDEGDIVFCGRIDGLVTMNGVYYVLENKFPGAIKPDYVRQFQVGSQLSGYQWAAAQHTNLPVVGSLINAVEFSKLPSSDRNCKMHAVPYIECGHLHAKWELLGPVDRTPEALVEWRKTAINLARRYQDLLRRFPHVEQIHKARMQGMFFNRCQFCAFFDWCKTGRRQDLIPSLLVHQPWFPFNYSKGLVEATAHKP